MTEQEKFFRFIRKPYGPTIPVRLVNDEESMTHQSFKEECDINTIMAKYKRTGLITHVNEHQGQYGQFVDVQDYQTSMNQIIDAQNAFMELPAALRKRFNNDAGDFLAFVQDPKNADEMVDLGLRPRPPAEPRTEASPPPAPPPKPEE